MGNKYHRYKVTGIVKFSIDDIVVENPQQAINQVTADINDDVAFAAEQGNIEIVELNSEDLGLCDKDKFYESREC